MKTPQEYSLETLLRAHTLHRRRFLESVSVITAATNFQAADALSAEPEGQEKLTASSVELSGENQYLSIPRLRYTGHHPLTIEALVTPSEIEGERTIIGNHQSNGLALRMKGGFWEFVIHDGKRYVTAQSDALIEKDQPVHLAGVCDGRAVGLFVNREPQRIYGDWHGKHKASRYDFLVGADPDSTGRKPQHCFAGEIAALRLSAAAKDFRKVDPFAPVNKQDLLYWTCEEGEGNTVKDQSRFRHDGILHGATWVKRDR